MSFKQFIILIIIVPMMITVLYLGSKLNVRTKS